MQFLLQLFHDGGHYHIETSFYTSFVGKTDFYIITASVMKELITLTTLFKREKCR